MKPAKAVCLSLFAGSTGIVPKLMTGTPGFGWSNLKSMQEGTTCFQSVVTKHSTCSDNIKIWEQETYNSSSLIVLMHARLMVLSAHVQRENLL